MYTLEDLVNDKELTGIINDYWKDYVKHRNLDFVVKPSIPIIWFGDLVAYKNSDVRIVTLGLNPSDKEFKKEIKGEWIASFHRFPDAEKLIKKDGELAPEDRNILIRSYNNYFKMCPYMDWFDKSYKPLFNILSDYYDGKSVGYGTKERNDEISVIHIDCQTALATDPVWGQLKSETESIRSDELYKEFLGFLKYLKPNIILFSQDQKHFPLIQEGIEHKRGLIKKLDKTGRKIERVSYDVKGSLLIWGTYYLWHPFEVAGKDLLKQKKIIQEILNDYQSWKK